MYRQEHVNYESLYADKVVLSIVIILKLNQSQTKRAYFNLQESRVKTDGAY